MILILLMSSLLQCGFSETDFLDLLLPERLQGHPKDEYDYEYDFIVVGSGPAGSAVAARLAEIPEFDVLLLEAGREGTIFNDVPALHPIFPLTAYSWSYKSEFQEGISRGQEGRVCPLTSGRGVGGGSVMNGMLMTRGDPKDYDKWNQTGWHFNDVFPYFLKSENINIENLKGSRFHSSKGAVNVEHSYPSNLRKRFLDAGVELGYDIIDYNDPRTFEGFGNPQVSTKNGRRFSASSAYLKPMKDSSNFHLSKDSLVIKILIDPKTKTANGVVYKKNMIERTVYARKEIILSAGAYNTPKLLMLSGIGPKDHLVELKISVIKDLPVGNNLQNHLTPLPLTFLINSTDSFTLRKFLNNLGPYSRQWAKDGTGPLANCYFEGVAFLRTSPDIDRPDIELSLVPFTWFADYGIASTKVLGIINENFYTHFGRIGGAEGFSIVPILLHPKSRGMVRLRSKNHHDHPRIILNSLNDPDDIKVLIKGIRTAIRLVKTSPFIEIGAKFHKNILPGCKRLIFGSDQYWECVLREITFNIHHHCCTAKMGHSMDSVVDNRLRVHGIRGLRVADASIMPNIPAGHLMYPCYMIGEKAADMIKEDWGKLHK